MLLTFMFCAHAGTESLGSSHLGQVPSAVTVSGAKSERAAVINSDCDNFNGIGYRTQRTLTHTDLLMATILLAGPAEVASVPSRCL